MVSVADYVLTTYQLMELAKRDMMLSAMGKELAERKNMLSNQLREIATVSSENRFLEQVKNDYRRYYDTMLDEKRQQCAALEMISEYLSSITGDLKLAGTALDETKVQQGLLLAEIEKVRGEIDALTQ